MLRYGLIKTSRTSCIRQIKRNVSNSQPKVIGNLYINKEGTIQTVIIDFNTNYTNPPPGLDLWFKKTKQSKLNNEDTPFRETIAPVWGFKKTYSTEDPTIQIVTELVIPPGTIIYSNQFKSTSLDNSIKKENSTKENHKYRAECAFIVKQTSINLEHNEMYNVTRSCRDLVFTYETDMMIYPKEPFFDEVMWKTYGESDAKCKSGIHFFLDRKSAEKYEV